MGVVVKVSVGDVSSEHDMRSDGVVCLGIDPQVLEDDTEFPSISS